MPIYSYTYGAGTVIKQGPTSWGGWYYLATFPGFGRRFVEARDTADFIFSNN